MSEEERREEHKKLKAEATFDMDNPPKQFHKWVDRGEVMSCEGSDHPNHRHFKTKE